MDHQIENPEEEVKQKKFKNSWIYLTIIFILIGTNIYLFIQKKQTTTKVVETQERLTQETSEREIIQKEFDASLIRLDNLTTENSQLKKALDNSKSELASSKNRIQAILAKTNATELELKEARELLKNLNVKISSYEQQIASLKTENKSLQIQRDSVQHSNVALQEKVEIAKILSVSNIRLKAIDLRRSGRKEKETTKAKRVDLLRIVFDVNENKIIESGLKTLQIRIINPKGELLSNAALGSGSFNMKDGHPRYYSVSKEVNLSSEKPLNDVVVDWKQSADYETGPYLVEVYYEGYLVGSGYSTLR